MNDLLSEVRTCTRCEHALPYGARPILQAHPAARILIAGQAPGKHAHESGLPFDDASGKRLRDWLGVSRETFYTPELVAILPMAFCYPGTGSSGDLPPRIECAVAWRAGLLARLEQVELCVVLGRHAQQYHFGNHTLSLTQLVSSWRDYWPRLVPLPHPSPRNNPWLRRNPWFEQELLPPLRQRVAQIVSSSS